MSSQSTVPSNLNEDDIDFIKELIRKNTNDVMDLFNRLEIKLMNDRIVVKDLATGYSKQFPRHDNSVAMPVNPSGQLSVSIYDDPYAGRVSIPIDRSTLYADPNPRIYGTFEARETTGEEPPF